MTPRDPTALYLLASQQKGDHPTCELKRCPRRSLGSQTPKMNLTQGALRAFKSQSGNAAMSPCWTFGEERSIPKALRRPRDTITPLNALMDMG